MGLYTGKRRCLEGMAVFGVEGYVGRRGCMEGLESGSGKEYGDRDTVILEKGRELRPRWAMLQS